MTKIVTESLKEFKLNESAMVVCHIIVDYEVDKNYFFKVINKDDVIFEGWERDLIKFLLSVANVDNTFEAQALIRKAKAMKSGGMISGETLYKKGHWGNKTENLGNGKFSPGVPIMISEYKLKNIK